MPLSSKRRTFLFAFAVACFLMFGPFAPSSQEADAPPGPAGPQHAWLARDAGEWQATVRLFGPDGSVDEFEGLQRNHIACGGLWLVSDFEADFMGAPFLGHSLMGYDAAERALVSVWVDSTSTRVVHFKGSLTEDVRVLMTRGTDPVTGEEYPERHVTRYTGPDERVFTMSRTDADVETRLMEIIYRRIAK